MNKHNLKGQVLGELTVLYRLGATNKSPIWVCKCSCGEFVERNTASLTQSKHPKCPTCEQKRKANRWPDLTGKTLVSLRAIELLPERKRRAYLCECTACGKQVERTQESLVRAERLNIDNRCCLPKNSKDSEFTEEDYKIRAALNAPPKPVEIHERLDVARNRERYVRLKLSARAVGDMKAFLSFPEYTCAECPKAPKCEFAFDRFNTDGDCLEAK